MRFILVQVYFISSNGRLFIVLVLVNFNNPGFEYLDEVFGIFTINKKNPWLLSCMVSFWNLVLCVFHAENADLVWTGCNKGHNMLNAPLSQSRIMPLLSLFSADSLCLCKSRCSDPGPTALMVPGGQLESSGLAQRQLTTSVLFTEYKEPSSSASHSAKHVHI